MVIQSSLKDIKMSEQILDNQEEENKGEQLKGLSQARKFHRDLFAGSLEQLDLGKSKSEIFSHFISKYGTRYQKRISKVVGFSISTETAQENKLFLQILIGLQIIISIGHILIGYTFYSAGGSLSGLFFSVGLFLWVDILIFRKLFLKRLDILPLMIIFSAYGLIGIYSDLDTFHYGEWIYVYACALVFSLVISFYFKRKLFPNFGFFGPKKGEFERYKF